MGTKTRHQAGKIIAALDAIEAEFPEYEFLYKNDREFEFYLRADKAHLKCELCDSDGYGEKKSRWWASNSHLDIRGTGHDAKTAMHNFGVQLAARAEAYAEMSKILVGYAPTAAPVPKPKRKFENDTHCRQKIGCTCDSCRGYIPGMG